MVGVGLVLPVLALALALWLGFDYTPVTAYFMLSVLAVTVISEHQLMESRVAWLVLAAAVVAQVIVAVAWPPYSAGFSAWQHAVFG
jgi:Kef-type K+ transport system membrane component KefB